MSAPGMFEIVRTSAGWHARYRASNHEPVWSTEVYTERRAAVNAIALLPGVTVWLESYTPLEVDEREDTAVDEQPEPADDADPTWVNQSDVEPE